MAGTAVPVHRHARTRRAGPPENTRQPRPRPFGPHTEQNSLLLNYRERLYVNVRAAALRLPAGECERLGAYLVTESVPLTAPAVESGSRTTGLANIVLLGRPAGLDQATWLTRWQRDHTSVAIEAQATFGYTQNWVVRTLTPDAPGIEGIV